MYTIWQNDSGGVGFWGLEPTLPESFAFPAYSGETIWWNYVQNPAISRVFSSNGVKKYHPALYQKLGGNMAPWAGFDTSPEDANPGEEKLPEQYRSCSVLQLQWAAQFGPDHRRGKHFLLLPTTLFRINLPIYICDRMERPNQTAKYINSPLSVVFLLQPKGGLSAFVRFDQKIGTKKPDLLSQIRRRMAPWQNMIQTGKGYCVREPYICRQNIKIHYHF